MFFYNFSEIFINVQKNAIAAGIFLKLASPYQGRGEIVRRFIGIVSVYQIWSFLKKKKSVGSFFFIYNFKRQKVNRTFLCHYFQAIIFFVAQIYYEAFCLEIVVLNILPVGHSFLYDKNIQHTVSHLMRFNE